MQLYLYLQIESWSQFDFENILVSIDLDMMYMETTMNDLRVKRTILENTYLYILI